MSVEMTGCFSSHYDLMNNVHMDGDRLHQAITNLMSNAIKFSNKGSKISVFVEAKNVLVLDELEESNSSEFEQLQSQIEESKIQEFTPI